MSELNDLINNTLDNMPEVTFTESVIAVEEDTVESSSLQAEIVGDVLKNSITDSAGDFFDAEIHATDENGEPKLTSTGKFRKKSRKRGDTQSKLSVEEIAEQNQKAQNTALGAMSAMMMTNVLTVLVSDEFRATEQETAGLTDAFANFYEAKGIEDISPNAALCLVIFSYALPRFVMPKTKTKLQTLKEKLVIFVFNFKEKRATKKALKEALAREKADK